MTAARIEQCFAACRAQGRPALIIYLTVGDPSVDDSLACALAALAAGADILELGVPFSDPSADGPVIAAASQRAIRSGGSLRKALEVAGRIREESAAPLVLFSYVNPLIAFGEEQLPKALAAVGVDAVLVVDLPPEEGAELRAGLARESIAVIPLIAPTTDPEREAHVLGGAQGFVYYVSVAGVTGAGVGAEADISAGVERAKRISKLPVAVGFGVRTPEQAAAFARISDGVVVGSALVEEVRAAVEQGDPASSVKRISVVAKSLSNAIVMARSDRSVH